MTSRLAVGDGFDLDAGPFKSVIDTPDPGAKRKGQLFDAVNMTVGDPDHGSAIVARHGFAAWISTIGTAGNGSQCVFLHRRADSTLDRFVFAGGKMYRWDGTQGPTAYTDITPTNVAIHPTNPIFCLGYNEQIIVTDEQYNPWVYDIIAATATLIRHNGVQSTFATRGGFTNYANKIFCIARNSLNSLYFLALPVTLARGSTDTQLAIGAFSYRQGRTGGFTSNSAINPYAIGALGSIPINKWGVIAIEGNPAVPLYTFTSGAANYTTGYSSENEAIAALPLPLATAVRVGYITVRSSASIWRAGTDAFAGGATGNPATFTNYYPQQYPDVAGQNTIMWSEELTPLVGYVQSGFDNSWTLTQTSDEVLAALDGEEGILVYLRNTGIGTITGAVTTDFKSSATRDSISTSTGTDAPAATASINKRIWSVDLDGNPYRVVGGVVQMLNLPLRRAIDEQVGTARNRPNVAQFARIGHHERYNMVLYTIWDAFTLYGFDEPTGNYVGTWDLYGPSAVEAMGPMVDSAGRSTFLVLGSTGHAAITDANTDGNNVERDVYRWKAAPSAEASQGHIFTPPALNPVLSTVAFWINGDVENCDLRLQIAEWLPTSLVSNSPVASCIGTIAYTSGIVTIVGGSALTKTIFSPGVTLNPAKRYIAFLNVEGTPVPVGAYNTVTVNNKFTSGGLVAERPGISSVGLFTVSGDLLGAFGTCQNETTSEIMQYEAVWASTYVPGKPWTEKHSDDTNQWLDELIFGTPVAVSRAIETQWLTKNAVTAYRATDVSAQLLADTARHAVRLQYVTPSAGLSTAVTAQSTATTGEKSSIDSISVARWSTGPNAQGTAIRFRLSATHVDNVRWGVQTITIGGVVTQARGDQK